MKKIKDKIEVKKINRKISLFLEKKKKKIFIKIYFCYSVFYCFFRVCVCERERERKETNQPFVVAKSKSKVEVITFAAASSSSALTVEEIGPNVEYPDNLS